MSDRAKRQTHTKSRTGCQACKQRHVRCDEQQPQCISCDKRGITCIYPSASHESLVTWDLPNQKDLHPQAHETDVKAKSLAENAVQIPSSGSQIPNEASSGVLAKPSTASLNPYSGFSVPLTGSKRAQLAFCLFDPRYLKIEAEFGLLTLSSTDCNVRSRSVFIYAPIIHEWNLLIVQQASQTPGLAHAVLGIASKTIRRLQDPTPVDDPQGAETHKVAAINYVNRKIQDTSSATEVSTLMTVSVLLGFEVENITLSYCFCQPVTSSLYDLLEAGRVAYRGLIKDC